MSAHVSRFQSTVPFYSRYRLSYPPRLIERVIELTGLKSGDAILDLGAGPGLLAIPFAAAGMRVTAADPEPLMLQAAGEAAREAGVMLTLWGGGSDDLAPGMGPYRLVTMGRSFHWMDRAATLTRLDGIIAPGGAVVLFHDEHLETAENHWLDALDTIANRYGRDAEPVIAEQKSPDYRSHESHLFASRFNVLEAISVIIHKPISADEILGRALSMSTCSPEKLGERIGAFESELRQALADRGEVTEIVSLVALIARRP
ncbi:MAG TPA: class I SAM-dependent methyltransferase [Steroidobacteraceae bacterium]|jgi:ubiquinone/menaquinone biosynthesis C-methylase UbiE|nr:class I SAM-dependent methyltransferase [Steroidobacteraceae bacterium]